MLQDVMTGNIAMIKIGGQVVGVGIINNVNVSDDYGLQDIDGIGQSDSSELVPGASRYNVSMSKFFVIGKKLSDLGYQPDTAALLTAPGQELEILDTIGGRTLEHYTGLKMASGSRSYGKHAPSTEDASFRALHKIK